MAFMCVCVCVCVLQLDVIKRSFEHQQQFVSILVFMITSWKHIQTHTHTHRIMGVLGISSKSKSVGMWNQARGQTHRRFMVAGKPGTKDTHTQTQTQLVIAKGCLVWFIQLSTTYTCTNLFLVIVVMVQRSYVLTEVWLKCAHTCRKSQSSGFLLIFMQTECTELVYQLSLAQSFKCFMLLFRKSSTTSAAVFLKDKHPRY